MRAVLVVLVCVAGCVEVSDRVFVGQRADGATPGGGDAGDVDDPSVDAGPRAADAEGVDGGSVGRADGAMPGDAGSGPMALAEVRCGPGEGLLPGLEVCVAVEALPGLRWPRMEMWGGVLDGVVWVGGGRDGGEAVVDGWRLGDGGWVRGGDLVEAGAGAGAAVFEGAVWVVGGDARGEAVQRVDGAGAVVVGALGMARVGGFSVSAVRRGVVVVGGVDGAGALAGVEVVGAGGVVGELAVARSGHAAAVDEGGALWVVGGVDAAGEVRFAPEVLEVGEVGWRAGEEVAAWGFRGGAAAWSGGALVVAGGVGAGGARLRRAVVWDGVGWREVGGLNGEQRSLTLTALGDEGALLAVGSGGVEVFDPVHEAFYGVHSPFSLARAGHVALAVDGGVVVVGGERDGRATRDGFRVVLRPMLPPAEEEGEERE